jgi:hypothetical protein
VKENVTQNGLHKILLNSKMKDKAFFFVVVGLLLNKAAHDEKVKIFGAVDS